VFSADLDALREENARLQKDLTRALEERNRLLKKVSDSGSGLKKASGSRVLEERLEGARGEIDRLNREKRQRDDEVAFLHDRLDEISRIPNAFLSRLEEIVSAVDGSSGKPLEPIENPAEDPEKLADRFNSAAESLWTTLQSYNVMENKALREEVEELKADLESQHQEIASRGDQNQRLAETTADLETALRDAATEAADQEGKLANLRNRLEELEEENRRLAKSNLKLKAQIKDLRAAVDPDVFGYVTSASEPSGGSSGRIADRARSQPVIAGILLGALLGGGGFWLYTGANTGDVEPYVVSTVKRFDTGSAADGAESSGPGAAGVSREEATTAAAPAPIHAKAETRRDRLRGGGYGPSLIDLPSGTFTIGTDRYAAADNEKPARLARVKDFLISRYEITFDQYDAFAKATGRSLPADEGWGRGSRPVVNVTWDDARSYAQWLSEQTGHNYRLPTEVEWEFAMAGGFHGIYWWGNRFEQGREICLNCGTDWDGRRTAPVGSAMANTFGLYDMGGNVMEWVHDCLPGSDDGGRPGDRGCVMRVVRGGAFDKPDDAIRTTARRALQANTGYSMVGFRVVREG
jgi:formylglycine-generating enzyme required for sulfatase activity